MKKNKFTFIDLFAGIGGFHTAMHSVGGKCVFASEWDKYARISYEANYKDIEPDLFQKDSYGNYLFFNNDITEAIPESIPAFDVCCGGFPCQPFSIAGLRRGFEDTRGTLFFNIANIVKQKIDSGIPPKVLFLENVKGLKTHMKGETLKTILATLDELGYAYNYDVLNAKYFGVPQNRERLFIVAWYKDIVKATTFKFPYGIAPDAGEERKQVGCDTVAVDVHLCVRLYHGRQVYLVNIDQRIGTDDTVTCPEIFVRSLEVGHRERSVPELECHETVAVLADFLLAELSVPDMLFRQNIIRL